MTKHYFYILLFVLLSTSVLGQKKEATESSKNKKNWDPISKIGFWFDFSIGAATIYEARSAPCGPNVWGTTCYKWGNASTPPAWATSLDLNLKVGNKWYIHYREKYQLGFQMTWMEAGIYLTNGWYINPGSIGFISILKLSPKMGLEINCNVGPHVLVTDVGYAGVQANVETKFRFRFLAIGINIAYLTGKWSNRTPIHTIAPKITMGCKF